MITLLKPIGHCFGVLKAIEIAKETKEKYKDKNIYVFGLLVHNEEVVKDLEEHDIKTIEMNEDNAIDLLNKFTSDDVVIFTAHGHPRVYEDILKKNDVTYVDATCSKVKDCFNVIKEAKEVIYIGKAGHPETVAALTMNQNAHLYDIRSGLDYSLIKSDNPLVINQTTLSFLELARIHQEIKDKLTNAVFYDEICNATLLRQKAINELGDDVDTVIIVGSKKSSNTMKLYEIAKNIHPDKHIVLVNNVNELKEYGLVFKNAVIASGTSTSIETINEIKDYLSSL
ncbi:MAG: 4-hydroxy-3-methylbut-2-enyl diphosphate reductase [Bacilli bacterium]|nr:4-hydroxy-3-methylbut-2-enyl diphosphate reductase [Bacilli bacterium]